MAGEVAVHTTSDGVEIHVKPGTKSAHDFIVSYVGPKRRHRRPKHIHWLVDLLIKHCHAPERTRALVEHLRCVEEFVRPATSFPPELQVYSGGDEHRFAELEGIGEYSVDFLLVVVELILIQERTNYPDGNFTDTLLKAFLDGETIHELVGKATLGRRA